MNDALAVEGLLSGFGFAVTVETNRDLRRMRRVLQDFREDGAGADVAADGDRIDSPFTEALLRHFATPGVEVRTALTLM